MSELNASDWASFKAIAASEGFVMQFEETANSYRILMPNDGVTWAILLAKGTADADDFEANFKDAANKYVANVVKVVARSINGLTITFGTSSTRATADGLTDNEDFAVVAPGAGNRLKIKSILSSNLNLFSGVTAKFRFGSSDYFNKHNVPVSDAKIFDYPKFDLLGAVDESFKANSTGMSYSVTVEYSET